MRGGERIVCNRFLPGCFLADWKRFEKWKKSFEWLRISICGKDLIWIYECVVVDIGRGSEDSEAGHHKACPEMWIPCDCYHCYFPVVWANICVCWRRPISTNYYLFIWSTINHILGIYAAWSPGVLARLFQLFDVCSDCWKCVPLGVLMVEVVPGIQLEPVPESRITSRGTSVVVADAVTSCSILVKNE